jgi:threonylcarbamoyladenosine tRNA methylthiotransferase MtaB
MFSLSVYTLGCKLNQLESESIAEAFRREGFTLIPWEADGSEGPADTDGQSRAREDGAFEGRADILVVNTCTVTSKAEQKARRVIRKALRDHPRSCVIVTGCYAQLEGEALMALAAGDGADEAESFRSRLFVVSGDRKGLLLDLPRFLANSPAGLAGPEAVSKFIPRRPGFPWAGERSGEVLTKPDPFRFNPADFSFHSRAFLKIQDGCDKRCSYCRVCLARGKSQSLEADKVLAALRTLEARAYGEAVLTGVNINQYRDERARVPLDLAGLLEYLLDNTQRIALRISSTEPEGLTENLAKVLANPRIRPHFHLSVQSGSPLVLKKMRRPYTPEDLERGVGLLRSVKDDPFLACDIITGFPGETDGEFEKTWELCRRIGFSWIHGFPYSARPGTEAYRFTDRVSEREAARRMGRLLELARNGRREYVRRWVGREVEAVTELKKCLNQDFAAGISDNYLKLMIILPPGGEFPPGSVLRCRIRQSFEEAGGRRDFDAVADPVR